MTKRFGKVASDGANDAENEPTGVLMESVTATENLPLLLRPTLIGRPGGLYETPKTGPFVVARGRRITRSVNALYSLHAIAATTPSSASRRVVSSALCARIK